MAFPIPSGERLFIHQTHGTGMIYHTRRAELCDIGGAVTDIGSALFLTFLQKAFVITWSVLKYAPLA